MQLQSWAGSFRMEGGSAEIHDRIHQHQIPGLSWNSGECRPLLSVFSMHKGQSGCLTGVQRSQGSGGLEILTRGCGPDAGGAHGSIHLVTDSTVTALKMILPRQQVRLI